MAACLVLGPAHAAYEFSHFAGTTGGSGSTDGVGGAARFSRPLSLAIAPTGELYVVDTNNHTIRKVTASGTVSTFAGTAGLAGNRDGQGTTARFFDPQAVVVDRSGNVYVADTGNQSLRKISPTGLVSTLAGSGSWGYADGTGANASFFGLDGLAVDDAGNVYVADEGNRVIRKVDAQGVVTTIAGGVGLSGSADGSGADARFGELLGLVWAPDGRLYGCDASNNTIRSITAAGVVTTYAGVAGRSGFADGAAAAALFSYPWAIAADRFGALYITDAENNAIRKLNPDGQVATLAGGSGRSDFGTVDGPSRSARFFAPMGVCVGGDGTVYVTDGGNSTIRRIAPDGQVSTLAGKPAESGWVDGVGAAARFAGPVSVAVDQAGNVYVADFMYTDRHIRKITPGGAVSTIGEVIQPSAVAVDTDGNVYVADWSGGCIYKFSANGESRVLAGNPVMGHADGSGASASFWGPMGLAADRDGNVYVADTDNHTIRKITPTGEVTTIAGRAGEPGHVDGPAASARFSRPWGIAVDRQGDLYVTDFGANLGTEGGTIRKISLSRGEVTTFAGDYDRQGTRDGIGGDALFATPMGIAADAAGNLFVTQSGGTIRKISPAGVVTTIGGYQSITGSEDGVGSAARFSTPSGIAVDRDGNVYVADQGNHAIRKGVEVRSASSLVNIATRAAGGTGNAVTIGGFVVSGTTPKRVLIRAIGPTLASQGLGAAEVLADPLIEVHDARHGNAVVATNDNWTENANADEIPIVASRIGANPIGASDTRSSALLLTLPEGVYTFVTKGRNDTSGVVLLEVYDAEPEIPGARFVNIATRANATTGNGVAIGGFVIRGNAPKQVLVRALGPTLTTQGLVASEVLADPVVELHDARNGNAVIATNDNWGDEANASAITATSARVGAAPMASGDNRSAALLMTLQPGVYSFVTKGKNDTSGIVLLEVYDAD